jgi:hypothetical protein
MSGERDATINDDDAKIRVQRVCQGGGRGEEIEGCVRTRCAIILNQYEAEREGRMVMVIIWRVIEPQGWQR